MRDSIRKHIELAPAHTPVFADQRWTIGASTEMAIEKVRVVDRFVGCGLTRGQENRKNGFHDSEIAAKARKNTHDDFDLPFQIKSAPSYTTCQAFPL
jgi:hypothetical protein